MGRLFWKVFFGFWLMMIVIAVLAALAVFVAQQANNEADSLGTRVADGLLVGRRADNLITRLSAVLHYGGEAAARELMTLAPPAARNQRARRLPRLRLNSVMVVDDAGSELLGRDVATASVASARRLLSTHGRGVRSVISREGNHFVLFVPRTAEMRRMRRILPWYRRIPPQIIAASGLLFSLMFSALLAWYLARPIRALRSGFDKVAAGNLDTRVATQIGSRRDELADLGTHFDQTIERLQQVIQSQQRLLHDVSHELRSPLARIQAAIGLTQQNPDRTEQMLERIEHESIRLDSLVGEILTLARLDEQTSYGQPESFDLDDLVADIASDARFEALERALRITVTGSAGHVIGYPTLLQRAVENLVRNAIKYSGRDTEIQIALQRQANDGSDTADRVTIAVRDHGPGVPADKLDTITEPFTRLTPDNLHRTQKQASTDAAANGFGLGLAIAQRAVDIHHGQLRFTNHPEGGLVATIAIASSVDATTEQ